MGRLPKSDVKKEMLHKREIRTTADADNDLLYIQQHAHRVGEDASTESLAVTVAAKYFAGVLRDVIAEAR